ncbi:Conserved hypothetical protein CHP02677, partial [Thiorhodococcus drewsii AZ1]
TDLYRTLMRAFSEAKEHFLVHLRPEDVLDRVRRDGRQLDLDAVQAALGQLVEWGNLQAEPDTSRVTKVEDFYRARYLYHNHPRERGRPGCPGDSRAHARAPWRAQSVALADIASQLRGLLMQPLLYADHPAYRLVKRHIDWLRDWLHSETRWDLRLEADFARLAKTAP